MATFKDNAPASTIDAAISAMQAKRGVVGHRYDGSILGFPCKVAEDHLSVLQAHSDVECVEEGGKVSAL